MEDIASSAGKVLVMSNGSVVMYEKTEVVFSDASKLTGIDLGKGIYTVKDAADAILEYINNK